MEQNPRSYGLLGLLSWALTFILQYPAIKKKKKVYSKWHSFSHAAETCWGTWQQVADLREKQTLQKNHCFVLRIQPTMINSNNIQKSKAGPFFSHTVMESRSQVNLGIWLSCSDHCPPLHRMIKGTLLLK